MIPSLIVVGLLLGKWWRVVIPVAAIGWAGLLVGTGVDSGLTFILGAVALGLINVTLGVLVFQGARFALHRVTGKDA